MYTFVAEFLALVILAIIIASAGTGKHVKTGSKRYFRIAVLFNIISILLDGVYIWGYRQGSLLPLWFHYAVLTLYWFASFFMLYAYTLYVLACIKKRVGKTRMLDIATSVATAATLISCVVTISSLFTHHMFYLDSALLYCHGPLWAVGYVQLGISITVVTLCSIRFRSEIGTSIRRIQAIGSPAVIMLFIFQALYPTVVMIGTAGTCFALVSLLMLQRNSIETDHLTGLGNQNDFLAESSTWKRRGNPKRIIVIFFDQIRAINVTYGSAQSDHILRDVAEWACEKCLRDNIYRISPTSFALVYPDCTPGEGDRIFASIQKGLPKSLNINGKNLPLSASFIDYMANDSATPELVLERIEYAHGKMLSIEISTMRVDDRMVKEFEEKKELTAYLENSVKEHRFMAYVQPIFCVRSNTLLSGEILCRLQGPDNSILSPARFIPIAEESRLVTDISRQTLEDVCWFLSNSPNEQAACVSVNLSMQQLMDARFVDELESMLATYNIERGQLALEITERMLVSRDTRVECSIERLRCLGYVFLMDDFGTGYSNIEAMMGFPFEKIKIDKSIVDLGRDDDYESLKTLIRLMHNNGFETVVEGVETKEQAARIIACGADYIQGFFYACPMPLESYTDFLSSWQLPFEVSQSFA